MKDSIEPKVYVVSVLYVASLKVLYKVHKYYESSSPCSQESLGCTLNQVQYIHSTPSNYFSLISVLIYLTICPFACFERFIECFTNVSFRVRKWSMIQNTDPFNIKFTFRSHMRNCKLFGTWLRPAAASLTLNLI
jgi:hypothetical protein